MTTTTDPTLGRCIHRHGERYGPARDAHQQFKRAVIARLGDEWELTDSTDPRLVAGPT